ncbi:MAG: methionyl-tRNA formyltransferase [Calditrichaeota bacterium]|nr:MAG: methionyl-tRNA formyltransferase [Calditrichota bacterium]
MKIIFFGTTDFAVESLRRILEENHEVCAVVTQPDRRKGRGMKLAFTPVKEFALEKGIPILQPENLKRNYEFNSELKSYNAELFVVVAYRVLPEEVFVIPPKGTFNLHGSLLPKFRGAAPINWAIIQGEKETGVTTFFIQKRVDTGQILLKEKTEILPNETFGELYERLKEIGSEATVKTIKMISENNFTLQTQDDNEVTQAPKLTRENTRIDWNKTALEVKNFILGLSPIPCSWTEFRELNLKILFAEEVGFSGNHEIGELVAQKKRLLVKCKDGYLSVRKLQPQGKKAMEVINFLNGSRIQENEKFI